MYPRDPAIPVTQAHARDVVKTVFTPMYAASSWMDLREEELYTQAPVKVSFPEEDHLDFSLTVRILNRKQVRLSDFSTDATKYNANSQSGWHHPIAHRKIVVHPILYYTDKWFNTLITIRPVRSTDTMASLFRKQPEHQSGREMMLLSSTCHPRITRPCRRWPQYAGSTVYNEETIKR